MGDEEYIPGPAKGARYYLVNSKEGYEGLYRRLTGQLKTKKRPLGKLRALAPREPRTDFLTAGATASTAELPAGGVGRGSRRREVTVILEGDHRSFRQTEREGFICAVAAILQIAPQQIRILQVARGSIRLGCEPATVG